MASTRYNEKGNRSAGLETPERPRVDLARQTPTCVGCVLCGSPNFRVVCTAGDVEEQRRTLDRFYRSRWRKQNAATASDRLTFTQNYTTGIVACLNCGLLYRNPRPASDAIFQAYKTDTYTDAYLRAEFETQRLWARTKIPVLARHLPEVDGRTGVHVLEIGSFVGGFLAEGQAQGWDMFGIDPGQDVTRFCRSQGLPVFHGTIENAAPTPMSFDAVVVWNTFDQLPDPHVLLRSAVPLLRNGGVLVLRVPNGACFDWIMRLRSRLPSGLRNPLDIVLGWNNLLTFPYLHGYSVLQLSELTASYGFRLRACLPEAVTSTPPGQLKWWATIEEHCAKGMCQLLAQVWQDDGSLQFRFSPWMDVYFERACGDSNRAADEGLGVLPVYAPMSFNQT